MAPVIKMDHNSEQPENLKPSTKKSSSEACDKSELKFEQRCVVKFYQKLGKTPTHTHNTLKRVYGADTLSKTQVFNWYKQFKEGRDSVNDFPRSGRTKSARNPKNIAKVREILENDRDVSLKNISSRLNISKGSCHSILTQDLKLKRDWKMLKIRLPTKKRKGKTEPQYTRKKDDS